MPVKNFFNDDHIFIENFHAPCYVGTTESERSNTQDIMLTLHLHLPLMEAGRHDDFNQTLDYADVINQIKNLLRSRKFNLIEAVAESIAELLLKDPRVKSVSVDASKKVFPDVEAVGVRITRPAKG